MLTHATARCVGKNILLMGGTHTVDCHRFMGYMEFQIGEDELVLQMSIGVQIFLKKSIP